MTKKTSSDRDATNDVHNPEITRRDFLRGTMPGARLLDMAAPGTWTTGCEEGANGPQCRLWN